MSKMDLKTRVREKPQVTKEDIKKGLRELGLTRGDNVGVHSSLSSSGYVEDGADTVINTLLETVGPEGTVVFPTYSNNKVEVEKTQEDIKLGVTFKYKPLPYNPKEDSCWTGKIPDIFWRRKEAIRGPNPTHSLAAIGARADELSQGWDKLLEADGYMLLLGVTLTCCSSMHLAERNIQLPQHILEKIIPPPELSEKYRKENIGFGFGPYPDFAKMEKPCREQGIMKTTKIGDAPVKFLRLKELIDLYAEYLRNKPDLFYHD